MATTLNIFDLIFFGFALIFIVVAFFRGFVKEFFSFIVWAVAFFASYFLAPIAADLLKDHMTSKVVSEIATRSVIFIAFFIGTTISVSNLSNDLHDRTPVVFNRSLGVFYGIIKTMIISGITYSIIMNSLSYTYGKRISKSSPEYPAWLKEAKTSRIVEMSGGIMSPIVDKFFNSVTKNLDQIIPQQQNLDEKIDDIMEQNSQELGDPGFAPLETGEQKDSGYSKKDIEKMNHLIEIIGK